MTKHSPGPWTLTSQVAGDEDISIYGVTPVHKNPRWIARVYGQGRLARKDPETAANAALLLAAPDMLAAIEDVLSWHDFSDDMHKPIEVRAAYMRARAAIAKAKGE